MNINIVLTFRWKRFRLSDKWEQVARDGFKLYEAKGFESAS
jgi:hypothetical protein